MCTKKASRVGERCFLGLVLKEGGGFVHLRDDLITSSEMICSTSDVVRFPSEVIFSTSEIEKNYLRGSWIYLRCSFVVFGCTSGQKETEIGRDGAKGWKSSL